MKLVGNLERFGIRKSSAAVDRAIGLLMNRASRSVPYYHDLFEGVRLQYEDVASAHALHTIPITSRQSLALPPASRFLRKGPNPKHLYITRTSGSTGTPATFFFTQVERQYRRLLLFRAIAAHFPRGFPWRITDVGQITMSGKPMRNRRLGPVLISRIPGDLSVSDQVTRYVASSPDLLEGYAGCLELLALKLRKQKTYPRPQLVISRGEILLEGVRKMLKEVFGCPVVNFYNSEEIGNIAWECPHREDRFHVNTDACFMELLDEWNKPVSPGIEGRVVLTNLYNHTMPLLRYDTGDYAMWESSKRRRCSCGAETPTLSAIHGRTDDFILMPDERRVSPLVVLTTALTGCTQVGTDGLYLDQVRQFQVVQTKIGHVHVRVVPGDAMPSDLHQSIQAEFRKLHPDMHVELKIVNNIPLEPSGKLKRIISKAT